MIGGMIEFLPFTSAFYVSIPINPVGVILQHSSPIQIGAFQDYFLSCWAMGMKEGRKDYC